MPEPDKQRPWGGFGTMILIVVAILVAYFLVLPVGLEVRHVFQQLTDAMGGRH